MPPDPTPDDAARLREAAAGSHEAAHDAICRALAALASAEGRDPWSRGRPIAVFEDRVVVVGEDDRLTQYDYTIADGVATLTNPTPVVQTFAPSAPTSMIEAAGGIAEVGAAAPDAGGHWTIQAIHAGLSRNGILYTGPVLRAAAPLIEGVRVLARSDEDHLRESRHDARDLIGTLANARFVESEAGGAIHADLTLLDPDGDVGRQLAGLWRAGATDAAGFSMVASGRTRAASLGGRRIRIAESIDVVDSVDYVLRPSAGGQIIRLIEAVRGGRDMALRQRMIEAVRERLGAARLEGIDTSDDDALETLYREALAAPAGTHTPATPAGAGGGAAPAGGAGNSPALAGAVAAGVSGIDPAVEKRIRLVEARVAIAASGLPAPAQARLTTRFTEAAAIPAGAVEAAIRGEREYLAQVAPGGVVTGLGDGGDGTGAGRLVESEIDKMRARIDALFDPAARADGPRSIKEIYVDLTGDRRVSGRVSNCDPRRLREAVEILPERMREAIQTGSGDNAGVLAEVFGDSIARRMQAEYRNQGIWGWWERVVDVVDVMDFRTQHRIRLGGYGDLPNVAQGAAYTDLPSPQDEEETYAATKRGGLETITLEAIKNDDMAVIGRIPVRLARAARRTLSSHVSSIFTTASGAGPTMGDTHALFSTEHGNIGTAALSAAAVAAGRLVIWKQTEKNSGEVLGIPPRFLLVPVELEETAYNLFQRNTNNDPNYVQQLSYEVVAVPDWTDATDWALVADPMDCPVIEVGFLDGMREPELFLQNMETVGSLFSNDQWKYKIRHVYGSTALDWRGVYKSNVTG